MFRLLLIALACAFVSACAPMNLYGVPPTPPPSRSPASALDAAEIANALRPGHAIVRGQAFSKTVGGDVKYGAGNEILVLPTVPYVSECIAIRQAGFQSDCMAKLMTYARVAHADGEGRFEIDDLVPGEYFLTTLITWGVPGPYGIQETGGWVSTTVTVASDTDVVTANVN